MSAFLTAALTPPPPRHKSRRHFRCIVAEGAPAFHGHAQARELADTGVHTTLVPDAAVFAVMPRVTKVRSGSARTGAGGGSDGGPSPWHDHQR